jgi:hypothetical protein
VLTLVICQTIVSVDTFLLNLGYWVVSACNFNLVNRALIFHESCIGAFLHLALLQLYPYYYSMHIIYFPTPVEYEP